MIDKEHQNKFIEVWEKGDYRLGSTAQRMLPLIMSCIPESATVNDYGCGTGRLEMEILKQRPNQKITMIDIAPNALEEVKGFLSDTVRFIEADLSDLNSLNCADWGLCINVLMTVQPDKLNAILSEISTTCHNFIFEAYDFEDYRLGYQMTTVKKNRQEWEAELRKYWDDVVFIQSPESHRRYIFICQ